MQELLRNEGISFAPWSMPYEQAKEARQWLFNRPVFNAHVRAKGTQMARCGDMVHGEGLDWPCFSHDMVDVVQIPHFWEYTIRGWQIACEYFHEPARLYSMNAFWTKPAKEQYKDTHDWHRDTDDRKQLVMFMYGSHISTPEDGAHLYQLGSHNVGDAQLGYDLRNPPEARVKTMLGNGGTMFFSDTRGLHMGVRPRLWPRLLMWARWGVSERPQSYDWDKLEPVSASRFDIRLPDDPSFRKAVELVVIP